MSLAIRRLPEQIQELSRNINDASVTSEMSNLVVEANVVSNSVYKAFSVTGSEVLQQKKLLIKVSCPSRVEIEKLSQTLVAFRGDLNICTNEVIALKTKINYFIGVNRSRIKMKENEIKASKTVIDGLDKQIQQTDQEINKYEEEANNEERGAVDLDNRASDLRREANESKEKGWVWGITSVVVGAIFAPFTFGVSLEAGLVSAGVGMAVNFNNANDCERAAVKMRVSAEDKRTTAKRKRQLKADLQSKKITKSTQLQNYKAEIENLSKTCDGLARLEMLLTTSLAGFERAIYIAQEFQNEVHRTLLAGDSFELIKEVLMECPDDFHDEAHEEMHKLKLKWIQLEQLFVSNTDHRGITF